ncbi:MAG: 30S ribosomal protein S8 [Candidatus Schekmanbacteria bacterium]|nr:30S ribosomal protein S8 [Candidatus Schekmanbacteria bacterium]
MVVNDPISDFLTRIRNANLARKRSVEVLRSNLIRRIADLLQEEGYLRKVEEGEGQWLLRLQFRLGTRGERPIGGIRRVSKPGKRVYVKADEVAEVLNGLGISVISTSQGIMTDREARRRKIGGEILCEVW